MNTNENGKKDRFVNPFGNRALAKAVQERRVSEAAADDPKPKISDSLKVSVQKVYMVDND